MSAPVEDLYETGFELSWWDKTRSRNVYEIALGVDGRFGDGYFEAIGSARLLKEF